MKSAASPKIHDFIKLNFW